MMYGDISFNDSSYRFRLIAMACNPYYTFSIDGHNMTIIEVDGVNSQPLLIDSLNIYAGQRYSFVVRVIVSAFAIVKI